MSKNFLRRSMASLLSVAMLFSTVTPNAVVYAEEEQIVDEIAQDFTIELIQVEHGRISLVVNEEEIRDSITYSCGDLVELKIEPDEGFDITKVEVEDTDGTLLASFDDGKIAEKDGIYMFEMPKSNIVVKANFEEMKEEEKEEQKEIQFFEEFNKNSLVSKEIVEQYDFSSKEIIVATDKIDLIIDNENIVDSGSEMYVLRYATEEHAKNAYSYYYGNVDFVAPNILVNAAENEKSEDVERADVGSPLDTLEQIGDATTNSKGTVIAVVDSGMPSNSNVTNRVSVINGGEDVGDDNGHGTKTMEAILSVNPKAKILSIKALDENGHGDVTSICAGIEYAKNSGAKIVVLPLYAYSVGENAALSTLINEVISSGIMVVGAAGNDGANVRYYVPGNIADAYIVGASNENGEKIASSNYGATVDYNVIANSTSEASAKFAGFLSTIKGSYNSALEKAADEQTLIFRTNEVKKSEEELKNSETAEEVILKYDVDSSKKAIVRYTFVDESLLVSSDNWDSIMNGEREKIITTTLTYTNIYKAEDGTYRMNVNDPWINGVALGKPIGYIFANGNNNGEVITKGVSFNEDTRVAVITEPTLVANEGDFANIQMQVIVPTNLSRMSKIGLAIESKNQETINTELSASFFDFPSFEMHIEGADGAISKDELSVYVNDVAINEKGFEYDNKTNVVTIKSYAMTVSNIRIVVDKNVNIPFDKAIADDKGNENPSKISFWLAEGTDVSKLKAGTTTTRTTIWGSRGYPQFDVPSDYVAWEDIGTVWSDTAISGGHSTAGVGYLGFPKDLFGINFQFYYQDGKSRGSWQDNGRGLQSSYNIGVPGYCIHEENAWQEASLKETKFKIVERTEKSNHIEFVMVFETTTGVMGAANGYAQNLGASVKFAVPRTNSQVKLKKVSSNPAITNDNEYYSLAGTTYELRKGSTVVAKFVLDKNGNCEAQKVEAGTYTLVETKAGKGYQLASNQTITVNASSGVQTFNVSDTPIQVPFKVKKTSANTAITKNNKCYSLAGTTYELRKGSKVVTTFVLDKNGECEAQQVPMGDYTLVETKAGKGYKLDPKPVSVSVNKTGETKTVSVKDEPNGDPFAISIAKKPLGGTVGEYPTTAGAEFIVKYYDDFYDSASDISGGPKFTWTFVSKAYTGNKFPKGTSVVDFSDINYLKSTSSATGLIIVGDSIINIPYGTIVVEETKAPENYLLEGKYITDINGTVKNNIVLNINYRDSKNPGIRYAGTNDLASGTQVQLETTDITTILEETMIPNIETSLTAENGTHFTEATSNVTLTDGVTLINCDSLMSRNDKITITGKLYDVETGKVVTLKDGSTSVSKTIRVNEVTEKIKNVFTFDATKYAGHTLVAVETVTRDGKELVKHDNRKDENQMVHFPKIGTTNLDDVSGKHIANIHGEIVLNDTVRYENLEPNTTYTVNGVLMDQKTGQVVVDEEGKEVRASTTFKTGKATDDNGQKLTGYDKNGNPQYSGEHKLTVSGSVVVTFKFKASEEAKETAQKYVAFENISGFAIHAEINDEEQTVYFPRVDTIAANKNNGEIALEYTDKVNIEDKVSVTGVSPDAGTLRLEAFLYDVETGQQLFKANGEPVHGSKEFTVDNQGNAIVTVYFDTFDAKTLKFKDGSTYNAAGKTVVVYEYLYSENAKVGMEAELTNLEQSVIFPDLSTTATENKLSGVGNQYIPTYDEDLDKAYIQDLVEYKNLLPHTTYQISGWLVNKETGETVHTADGKKVRVEKDFTTGNANTSRGLVNGNVIMNFEVTASMMKGATVVAFETISLNGIVVISHNDLEDQKQTVYFPGGHTNLTADSTSKHYANASETVTITDTIYYENLKPKSKYKVEGRLVRIAEEGETPDLYDENGVGAMYLVDANGNFVNGCVVEFDTPEARNGEQIVSGSIDVHFEVNAKNLAGRTIVAFETLTLGGRTVFIHQDLSDEAQSIHFPEIDTVATYADDTKSMHVISDAIIKDQVALFNIAPDAGAIKLTATVYDKQTGEQLLDKKGEPITASKTFTAVGDTTQTIEIPINVKELTTKSGEYIADGRTVVVFEELTIGGRLVGEHKDLTDIDQAVKFPSAKTTAKDAEFDTHYIPSIGERKINDVVEFTGLLPDKTYHIKGELMDKKTGEAIKDRDGNPIVVETDFVTTEGYLTSNGGTVVITNNTPFDENEYFMDAEAFNGDKVISKYDGAITAGVNKSNKHLVDGTVTVIFTVPAEFIAGKTTVVFETISLDGLEVITHANINDEAQTDWFPTGGTTLMDNETQEHISMADNSVKLIDVIAYSNMEPGIECEAIGVLMDRNTGNPVIDAKGNEVKASTRFTTPAAAEGEKSVDGEVEVIFEFDASNLENHTVVAYEEVWAYGPTDELWNSERKMFEHKDINDQNQTVHFPDGRTTAEDNATNNQITSGVLEEITIVDHVYYWNLLPGKEYTVNGVLMDKETGEAFVDKDGNTVTASTTFTAPEATNGADSVSGVVDVTFKFKGGSYLAGKTLVAFETCEYQGKEVFVHADINDASQSTYVPNGYTTLIDNATLDHIAGPTEKMSFTDVVFYENVKSGETYRVTGILMDKETGEPFLVDGEEIAQTKEFTIEPQSILDANGNEVRDHEGNVMMAPVSGSVDLVFEFKGSDELKGKTLVAFETMTYKVDDKDVEIFEHKDLNDEAQSIHIPDGYTTAIDSDTKDHISNADEGIVLIDTITYSNILAGKEYEVTGKLMNKETGEPILVDGKEVVSSTTLVAPIPEDGAKYVSGSVDVVFVFDGSALAGQTVVVFEEMTYNGVIVFTHADLNDKEQTIYIPEGETTVEDAVTNNHITSEVLEEITIVDYVYYKNLLPGREYTVKGVLMDKETGEALVDENGNMVTASTTFVIPPAASDVDSVSGVVDVTFKFKGGSYLAGKTLVAFETCEYQGKEVFVHADINDALQTIYVPDGHTTLIDNTTQDHIAGPTEQMSFTDTVYYENVKSGETYTITGILMDKDSGEPFLVDGKEVTQTKEFTIEPQPILDVNGNEVKDRNGNTMMASVSGSVELVFEFKGSDELKGKTLVAFETMTYKVDDKEIEIFEHKDLKDESQSIHIPEGHTNVSDSETTDRVSNADEGVVLVDTITYSNILAGKEYEVTGKLMNKETGEPILVDGKEVVSNTTLVAPIPEDGSKYVSGSVDVVFVFDGSALAGQSVVVFEEMTYNGVTVFTHADLNDDNQTQHFPDGYTIIMDEDTKDQITYAQNDEITIVDTVHYENLLAEREYEVIGVLYSKKTGEPLVIDGEEVRATTKFTTPKAKEGEEIVSGTVDVTFKFKGSEALEDDEFVAFETVMRNGKEVFVHADINDIAQTVTVPGGKTNATDNETKNHTSFADEKVTIIDRVDYEGLLPEKEYIVTGVLMNKETGEPIHVDGKKVIATTKFTTPNAKNGEFRVSGSVEVVFEFDGSALAGTTTVVFENVYYNGVKVFTHADLNDEAQTIRFPSLKTSVRNAESGNRTIKIFNEEGADNMVTMIDTVTYEGLEPGKIYIVEGVIMRKKTGEALLINNAQVTGTTVFTPEERDGSVEVTFTFNASDLKEESYVVFETLREIDGGAIVGVHKDINDMAQTFSSTPPTGDNTNIFGWVALAITSLGLFFILILKRRKETEEVE